MIIHLSSIVNTLLTNFISNFGYVAQSVEHRSYKSAVVGSSPAIPTKIYFSEIKKINATNMANAERKPGAKPEDLIKKLPFEKAYFIAVALMTASGLTTLAVANLCSAYNNPISGDPFTDCEIIETEVLAMILLSVMCVATLYTLKTPDTKD